MHGEYGDSYKKFSKIWLPNNDDSLSKKETESKKYDKMIDIALKFLDFYDKYNFNNVILPKNDKVFKLSICVGDVYYDSRLIYFYVKEFKPLSLSEK